MNMDMVILLYIHMNMSGNMDMGPCHSSVVCDVSSSLEISSNGQDEEKLRKLLLKGLKYDKQWSAAYQANGRPWTFQRTAMESPSFGENQNKSEV